MGGSFFRGSVKAEGVIAALRGCADVVRARGMRRFFKVGVGSYGEGDVFLGVPVPVIKGLVREFGALDFHELEVLLGSCFHEVRFFALMCLKRMVARDVAALKGVFDFYVAHVDRVNSWDLVDTSAPCIVGRYLAVSGEGYGVWEDFMGSGDLWRCRIAVVATLFLVRRGCYDLAIRGASLLWNDSRDLIQKAVGWVLREVGKRDLAVERAFLDIYAARMPRTMLRYAVERFTLDERGYYMGLRGLADKR